MEEDIKTRAAITSAAISLLMVVFMMLLLGNWRERAWERRNQTVALQYSQTENEKFDRLFSWYGDLTSVDFVPVRYQSEFQGNVLNESFSW